jgi:molybdopterin synthase sulfur carrier subunit
MKVNLKMFALFKEVFGEERNLELPDGAVIADLLDLLRAGTEEERNCLFDDDESLREYVLVMKNKQRLKRDDIEGTMLSEGDEIALYPPVAGG